VGAHKCACPFKEAEFDIRWGAGIDAAADLLDVAVALGVVEKKGVQLIFRGEFIGQGRERVREALLVDRSLAAAMRAAVEAAAPGRQPGCSTEPTRA
jgi:recombination protein RecA